MSLALNDLKAGQVVLDTVGNVWIVTGIAPNRPVKPVQIVKKAGGTMYVAPVSMFTSIVGTVDLEKFKVSVLPLVPATREPMFGDGTMPENIRALNLKSGDVVTVSHGFKKVTATFTGFNWNRPKYPVSYEINGKKWKGPYTTIVGKAA